MSIFNKFIPSFQGENSSKAQEMLNSKITLINIISALAILILVTLSVIMFTSIEYIRGSIFFTSSLLIALNVILLRKSCKPEIGGTIFLVIFSLLLLYEIVLVENINTSIIWLVIYPITALFTLGFKKGTFTSIGFLLITVIILFTLKDYRFFKGEYDSSITVLIIGIYVFIHILIFSLNRVYLHQLSQIENILNSTEQSSKSKDEFISKLSHQIRTPLNNIMVISSLLNEAKLDHTKKDLYETIIASTNNLVNIVNNIVKASTVEMTDIKHNKTIFNLDSTINSTLSLFKNQDNKKLEINYSSPENIQKINLLGDPVKIKQIFLNIIENILRFRGNEKLVIDINISQLSENNHSIQLDFSINPNKVIKISKDDSKTDSDMPEISVSDINISKRIIEASKSKLKINTIDNNTIFNFSLTFGKDKKSTKPIEDISVSPTTTSSKNVKIENANILLVEDNLINQKIVVLSLSKVVKNIDIANNGKEALDKFGSSRYDIILMDIQMPIMDGILATKKIREIEGSTNTHTPIIAITANALSGDRENCIAAGMNDYISKPFQVEDLVTKMSSLLGTGKEKSE